MAQQKTHRLAYALSATVSIMLTWMYFGFYPFGVQYGFFPPQEGTLLNDVMRLIAIPLSLLVCFGGGLAAVHAYSDTPSSSENERQLFAVVSPAGALWLLFAGLGFEASVSEHSLNSIFIVVVSVMLAGTILYKAKRHRII